MLFVSIYFYVFIMILVGIYYSVKPGHRWYVLLAGSVMIYYRLSGDSWWLLLIALLVSYLCARLIDKTEDEKARKVILALGISIVILPLVCIKEGNYILVNLLKAEPVEWIVPLGISFYSLQIVSYLVDVYRRKISPQKNLLKYTLFITFFPQIVQGPIPRYEQLGRQLYRGNLFCEKKFVKGLYLIIWGFFLKFMIADKAGIVVDVIFNNYSAYQGLYVIVAGVLYSIQLYTDFLACVCFARGIAELFGIELVNNFNHPYSAVSVKDFWRRWHISLSSWLRDYIYIPLGGNKKGILRKYINLIFTFAISGIWHGGGIKYIVWGIMHAGYQIVGEMTVSLRQVVCNKLRIQEDSCLRISIKKVTTFTLVMITWIIFRADNLKIALIMLESLVTTWNPWIFFDDSLLNLGMDWKELVVLMISVLILWKVEKTQRKINIRENIYKQHIIIRWGLCIGAIFCIMIFGTYGMGFDTKDFIYGGF